MCTEGRGGVPFVAITPTGELEFACDCACDVLPGTGCADVLGVVVVVGEASSSALVCFSIADQVSVRSCGSLLIAAQARGGLVGDWFARLRSATWWYGRDVKIGLTEDCGFATPGFFEVWALAVVVEMERWT